MDFNDCLSDTVGTEQQVINLLRFCKKPVTLYWKASAYRLIFYFKQLNAELAFSPEPAGQIKAAHD